MAVIVRPAKISSRISFKSPSENGVLITIQGVSRALKTRAFPITEALFVKSSWLKLFVINGVHVPNPSEYSTIYVARSVTFSRDLISRPGKTCVFEKRIVVGGVKSICSFQRQT